ncbi:piggyBac transposable element-derived protein 3-like [Ctenocephalides felis]|uniref:piggyBac transposable element-derived protein 3-like n=1 Tax=Ctenocephalides felis TaxID=7515 RepID=UPI000E6E4924|nr:piggyBac transposable element-derived protein 3-like [Ctenocephalides felis]
MRFRPGPKDQSALPLDVFKKFFSQNISFIIITETNRNAKDVIAKWNAVNPTKQPKVWVDMTSTELDAFIGILLAAGVTHNNMIEADKLWGLHRLPIFRAAMPFQRFRAIKKFIRFDDSSTRAFRQQIDKAAPITDIWNFLNENLANNHSPNECVTVDEQLFPYRGRTKFTQYIPSKPAKYGIKVWWACDAKTKYPLQGILYKGKEGEMRDENQGEKVLLKLASRYANTGRTMIADNFFATLEGVKKLQTNGIAFVGTIRANKRCVPNEMRKNSKRPELSTLFGFNENIVSICSYVPKKNKTVNLLSTVHYTKACQVKLNICKRR